MSAGLTHIGLFTSSSNGWHLIHKRICWNIDSDYWSRRGWRRIMMKKTTHPEEDTHHPPPHPPLHHDARVSALTRTIWVLISAIVILIHPSAVSMVKTVSCWAQTHTHTRVRAHTLLWSRHRYFSFSTACKEAGRGRQETHVQTPEVTRLTVRTWMQHENKPQQFVQTWQWCHNSLTKNKTQIYQPRCYHAVIFYFQFKVWCEVAADRIGSNRWKLKKCQNSWKKCFFLLD